MLTVKRLHFVLTGMTAVLIGYLASLFLGQQRVSASDPHFQFSKRYIEPLAIPTNSASDSTPNSPSPNVVGAFDTYDGFIFIIERNLVPPISVIGEYEGLGEVGFRSGSSSPSVAKAAFRASKKLAASRAAGNAASIEQVTAEMAALSADPKKEKKKERERERIRDSTLKPAKISPVSAPSTSGKFTRIGTGKKAVESSSSSSSSSSTSTSEDSKKARKKKKERKQKKKSRGRRK